MREIFANLRKQPVFFLVLTGILFAFAIHFLEIRTTQLTGNLHETADDASYLRPAENLTATGTWKDNSVGPSSYVQRPPFVGIVHLTGIWLFNDHSAWFIFIAALLFHGIAIGLLYKLVLYHSNQRNAFFFSLVFIISPCFWGFLSYSISEAFVIPGVIITSYFALTPHRRQLLRMLSALILLYLLRPVLILIFIPLLFSLFYHFIRSKDRLSLFNREALFLKCSLTIVFGFLITWEARKIYYTGTLSPHPIYHSQNESIFREPHAQLTELFKIWEVQPEVFHSMLGKNWTFSLSDQNEIKRYIQAKSVPVKTETLLLLLVRFSRLKSSFYQSGSLWSRSIQEQRFSLETESIRKKTVSENHFQYWVKTPVLSAKENLFKSHLNLTIFQETYRGNYAMELCRTSILALILMGYLSLLIIPFCIKARAVSLLCLGSWAYFLFLTEYQRMNEDRYFLPLVVTGLISLAILTFHISEHFKKRTN